ncbi:MAG: hypothetical protein Q9187_000391 [Circinaria calcarea]
MEVSSYLGLHTGSLIVAVSILLATLGATLWRHINHPLYRFPGPFLAAWSNLLHSYWFLGGRQPYKILQLHEKYGPVVRTAPNELSFNSIGSWKDIYGFRPGHSPFIKSDFYDGGSFADQAYSIVSERNPAVHGKMRKYLSHAFSDRSLKDQEGLVNKVVDEFIAQLGVYASGEQGANIVMWFNLTTFDIIGSLAFGRSFGGVKSGKVHFWIALVTKALRQGALADTFNRFPIIAKLFKAIMPRTIENLIRDTKIHERHTLDLIQRRIQHPSDRPDFLTRILDDRDTNNISDVQLAAHASDFVTAGSETTATALSCITYYLLRNPPILQRVQDEIRSAFNKYEEIDATAAAKLKYLHAVALEGMRLYAPLPFALPRVVPDGGDTVDGYYLPAGTIVSTNPVAASLSSKHFEAPLSFRPERWLGVNKTDQLEATQPFSLGPRGCLGRSLAWIELTTILAKLYFTYDMILLNQDLDWQRDSRMTTLWQKPELRVRVSRVRELGLGVE